MSPARKILFAVDESEECERALAWLREHFYKQCVVITACVCCT